MSELRQRPRPADLDERVAQMEARLARLEVRVGLDALGQIANQPPASTARQGEDRAAEPEPEENELEFEVGQNWVARAGLVALAAGGAFMLTLPYPNLPSALPTMVGVAVAAAAVLGCNPLLRGAPPPALGIARGPFGPLYFLWRAPLCSGVVGMC